MRSASTWRRRAGGEASAARPCPTGGRSRRSCTKWRLATKLIIIVTFIVITTTGIVMIMIIILTIHIKIEVRGVFASGVATRARTGAERQVASLSS